MVEYLAPVPAVHAAPAEYETPARAMDITDSLSPHISLPVVEASAPHVMETLRTLDVAMPPSVNEIVDVIHLVPREPSLQHTDEHIVGVPVVETQKISKIERSTPQKRISERIEEPDVVDVSTPQIVEEIVSAVTDGAPTPVVEYVALAPVDVSIAPIQALNTRPARVIEHVAHRVHCSCSNRGHNARSSHVLLDEYDTDLPPNTVLHPQSAKRLLQSTTGLRCLSVV